MASVLMKRCTSCKEYTLQETCPRCGAKAKPNRPAKFSPEDQYGEYRRKLKKMDAAKGAGNSDSERPAASIRTPTAGRATESTEPRKPASGVSGDSAARSGAKSKGA